jgi:TPR repeat protein
MDKTTMDMIIKIIEKIFKFVFNKDDIENNDIFKMHMIDLFMNNKVEDIEDDKYWLYVAIYYCVKENYELMKKYYLMAIEKGNVDAMFLLGWYYHDIYNEDELTKKYYLMAIDKGNITAMIKLGDYNISHTRNYDETKKYYLMAIDRGNSYAMYKLGKFYHSKEKNKDLMEKYYLMAIDRGIHKAMYYLGCYYKECCDIEKAKKYFIMASENGNEYAMLKLISIYEHERNYEFMRKYIIMALDANSFLHDNIMRYYSYRNSEYCLINDDIEIILKYNLFDVSDVNIKLILNYKIITKYFTQTKKLINEITTNRKNSDDKKNNYIDLVNLIYCD